MISASVVQQPSLSVSVPILVHPDKAISSMSKVLFSLYHSPPQEPMAALCCLLYQILTFHLAFTVSVILTQISHIFYFSLLQAGCFS